MLRRGSVKERIPGETKIANGNGSKGPLLKFRAGAISCALWESEANMNGQVKTLLKATVERRYKDASGHPLALVNR